MLSDRRSLLRAQLTNVLRVITNWKNSWNHGFYDECEIKLKHHMVNRGCNLMVMTITVFCSGAKPWPWQYSRNSVRSLERRDIDSNKTLVSDTGPLTFHCSLFVSCAVYSKPEAKFTASLKPNLHTAITTQNTTDDNRVILLSQDMIVLMPEEFLLTKRLLLMNSLFVTLSSVKILPRSKSYPWVTNITYIIV